MADGVPPSEAALRRRRRQRQRAAAIFARLKLAGELPEVGTSNSSFTKEMAEAIFEKMKSAGVLTSYRPSGGDGTMQGGDQESRGGLREDGASGRDEVQKLDHPAWRREGQLLPW